MVAKKSNASGPDGYKRPDTVAYQPDKRFKPDGGQTCDGSSELLPF
jgi:hypothetical protein